MKDFPVEVLARMMPVFVGRMVQNMPKAHRTDFTLNTISALMNHGTSGMSEAEKKAFGEKIINKLQG